jgi:RinA family phage transcriptional activator
MAKYRQKTLTHKVKGYVEWQLEHYKQDKRQLEEYRQSLIPSATTSYAITGGVNVGEVSKPTENTALKLATNQYILTTEQSVRAIEAVLRKCDETDLQLIDLVYWRRTHTVVGAGERVGLGQNGCYKRISKILTNIALELGLINP